MKAIVLLLLTFYMFPADVEGLREIKTGDNIPLVNELKFLEGKEKSVLLYLKSDEPRSIAFFRQFSKVYNSRKNLYFLLVDVNNETDKRVMILFNKIKGEKKNLNDPERKIYGNLGIIVMPTVLFINEAGILNSLIVSYRSNLSLFFKNHLLALGKGEAPGDVYKEFDKKLEQRKLNRITKQAFTLIIDGNYQLAENIYKKAVEKDSENEEAGLGYGYALIMQDKIMESEFFFTEALKAKDSKRLKLGLYLGRSITDPSPENIKNLSRFSLIEPSFFPAIYKAAEILESNGKIELSNKIFKRSYRVLLRTYRRNK